MNEAACVAYDSVTLESKYTIEEIIEEFKRKTFYSSKTCSKIMLCYDLDEENKTTVSLKFNKLCSQADKELTDAELGKFFKGELDLMLKTIVCSFKECTMKNVSKTKLLDAINKKQKKKHFKSKDVD